MKKVKIKEKIKEQIPIKIITNNYQNKKYFGNYGSCNINKRLGNNNYGQDDDNN